MIKLITLLLYLLLEKNLNLMVLRRTYKSLLIRLDGELVCLDGEL